MAGITRESVLRSEIAELEIERAHHTALADAKKQKIDELRRQLQLLVDAQQSR